MQQQIAAAALDGEGLIGIGGLGGVDDEEVEALKRNIQGMIQEALALLPQVPPEVRVAVTQQDNPVQLSYFLASVLDLGVETEQKMLESSTVDGLLTLTHAALARELEIMQIRSKIAKTWSWT